METATTKTYTLRVDDFGRTGRAVDVHGELREGGAVTLYVRPEYGSQYTVSGTCRARRTVYDQAVDRQPGMGHSRKAEYDIEINVDHADLVDAALSD